MKSKIFYGWWVVFSTMPATLVHAGAMFYIFGIFYNPLLREFGWSRTQVAAALSIYMVTVGFSGPVVGRLTDRFGPKKLIGIGALLGGIVFVLLTQISSLWQFYFLYFLQGITFAGCGFVPVNTTLANWFDKKRGTAIGVAMTGVSIGAITITPFGSMILKSYGWQATYMFLAVITWILVLPPVVFIMRDRPSQMGLLPDGVDPEKSLESKGSDRNNKIIKKALNEDWTPAMAVRSFYFWLICFSYLVIHVAFGSVLTHQIVYLTDRGIAMTAAAAVLGLTGGIGGAGKLFFGYISDKSSPKIIAPLCAALQAMGIVILLMTKSMFIVWIFAIVFGFCMGGHAALIPIVVGNIFGLRSFGAIYGIVGMCAAIGGSLGPILAGIAFETFGNYYFIFTGCIIASLGSALLLYWAIASILRR